MGSLSGRHFVQFLCDIRRSAICPRKHGIPVKYRASLNARASLRVMISGVSVMAHK